MPIGGGSILIQEVSSYLAYLGLVDSLEKEDGKVRTVFLFVPPGDNSMKNIIQRAEQEHKATGILIIVRASTKEWPQYQSDKKFKPNAMPWAGVYNKKSTIGRDLIDRTLSGDNCYDAKKFAFLFK